MNILLKPGKLLDDSANLISAGFAFDLVKQYRKSEILLVNRLKEINKYFILSNKFALALTLSSSYNDTFVSIDFIDFEKNITYSKSKVKLFGKGKVVMTPSSKIGSIEFVKDDVGVEIYNDYTERKIIFSMKDIKDKEDFYLLANLSETTNGTSVVACPFDKEQEFLYNQKINCIKVNGYVNIGVNHYDFDESTRASIDWIRGVYPKGVTKYNYACISTLQDGIEVGLTLVDKLGNTKYATPNMFFYDMHAFKLNEVRFREEYDHLHIDSIDGLVDLVFVETNSIEDSVSCMYEKVNRKIRFGKYNGYVMFDEERIEIKDLFGFIEVNDNTY